MAIKETVMLDFETDSIAGCYVQGGSALTLSDGDTIAISVGDELDEVIAFLQRVRGMQEPAPLKIQVDLGVQRDYGDETSCPES